MDKYLVKPTQIIGDNGLNYNIKDVDQLPAINEVKQRVYDLEIINGAINDRIDIAETNANQAVTEANLAYRMAKDLTDTIEQTSKSASTALENSIEAKENASSLNRDYENIKTRVEVLEGLDGNESIIVGPQTMGSYTNTNYTVKWANNTEVRTLAYNATNTLDQVLNWIHEPLANGLTNHETRIIALENGTVTSPENGTTVVNCSCPSDVSERLNDLESGIKLLYQEGDDSCIINTKITEVNNRCATIESNVELHAFGIQVLGDKVTALENNSLSCSCPTDIESRLTSHTNSIQSLDTRTGSHTASIGQLENRMVDVETQTSTNKTDISNIKTQIQNLGSGGSSTSSTTNLENDLKKHHYLLNSLSGLCSALERDENLNQDTKDALLDFINDCSLYLSECNYQN